MFDVSHKVDSSGWTTSVTGKMRSTLNVIFKLGLDFKALQEDIFTNYMNKVESKHLEQLEEQRIQREKIKESQKKNLDRKKKAAQSGQGPGFSP